MAWSVKALILGLCHAELYRFEPRLYPLLFINSSLHTVSACALLLSLISSSHKLLAHSNGQSKKKFYQLFIYIFNKNIEIGANIMDKLKL